MEYFKAHNVFNKERRLWRLLDFIVARSRYAAEFKIFIQQL